MQKEHLLPKPALENKHNIVPIMCPPPIKNKKEEYWYSWKKVLWHQKVVAAGGIGLWSRTTELWFHDFSIFRLPKSQTWTSAIPAFVGTLSPVKQPQEIKYAIKVDCCLPVLGFSAATLESETDLGFLDSAARFSFYNPSLMSLEVRSEMQDTGDALRDIWVVNVEV